MFNHLTGLVHSFRLPEDIGQPLDPLAVVAPTIVAPTPVAAITLTLAVPVAVAAVTATVPPADTIDNIPIDTINIPRNILPSNVPTNTADPDAKPTKPRLSRTRGAALATDTSNTRPEVSAFRNPYMLTPGPTASCESMAHPVLSM